MSKLERKFTPSELNDIMFEGGLYFEDDDMEFETVDEEITYSDLEKSYQNIDYVIKELSTGIFYKATLMRCSDQQYVHDENIKREWKPVQEYTKVIKEYR